METARAAYALLVAEYLEAFCPRADELSWRDWEYYAAFRIARAGHEAALLERAARRGATRDIDPR